MTDEERDRINAEAVAECQRAIALALSEFKRILRNADATYSRVRAEAWADFQYTVNMKLALLQPDGSNFNIFDHIPNWNLPDSDARVEFENTDSGAKYLYYKVISKASEEYNLAIHNAINKLRYGMDWPCEMSPICKGTAAERAEYDRGIDEVRAEYDRAMSRARGNYYDLTSEEYHPWRY